MKKIGCIFLIWVSLCVQRGITQELADPTHRVYMVATLKTQQAVEEQRKKTQKHLDTIQILNLFFGKSTGKVFGTTVSALAPNWKGMQIINRKIFTYHTTSLDSFFQKVKSPITYKKKKSKRVKFIKYLLQTAELANTVIEACKTATLMEASQVLLLKDYHDRIITRQEYFASKLQQTID